MKISTAKDIVIILLLFAAIVTISAISEIESAKAKLGDNNDIPQSVMTPSETKMQFDKLEPLDDIDPYKNDED